MRRLMPLLALSALLVAPPATAQQGPPPGGLMGSRRELIRARLHKLRAAKLQQSLGVPEDKANAMADRWERFDQDSIENRLRIKLLREQMNAILMGPGTEEEKNTRMQPLVQQMTALRQQQQDLRKKFEDDIRAQLTPAQQGRLLLVVEEMQHALMDAIREQRKESGLPAGE